MREILFRGKTKDDEWVDGFLFKYGCEYCISEDNIRVSDRELSYYCYDVVNPETVGQYTGLTDKNGNKIFEGDILKATDEKARTYIYKVVFINGIFGLVIKHGGYACPVVHWANNCIEVIGNIHDNPELLKGDV